MATRTKKKGGDDTGVRTKVVGVRLDPKLRYLAELAARKQRRSLSSFIEWAIEESLTHVYLYEGTGHNGDYGISVADKASELWDVDDAERFARLAIQYEGLLTHDEQVLWKLVKDSGLMWLGGYGRYRIQHLDWDKLDREVFPLLREHWFEFLLAAKGEISKDDLPHWKSPKTQESDFDDDIPF